MDKKPTGRFPEIASTIRRARKRTGLSQEKAAALVGCSRLQWIRWEQGLHKPSGEYATRLVMELGVPEELLEDAEDEEEAALDIGRELMALVAKAQAAVNGKTVA